jgi:hypothetical protein
MEDREIQIMKEFFRENNVLQTELIIQTINNQIQEKVNGKIDRLHEKIDTMEIENKSRGTAIYDIGEKFKLFAGRLEPVAKAFETNKLFSSMLVSKIKFLAMVSGSLLAIFAGWELIIKALIKPFIEK